MKDYYIISFLFKDILKIKENDQNFIFFYLYLNK